MRIIFLDIDGVMTTSKENFCYFKRSAIKNLEKILRIFPDVHIVISSTWRIGRPIPMLKALFESHSKIIASRIIDSTPITGDTRGFEIALWMNQCAGKLGVTDVVILDDDDDELSSFDHFIHAFSSRGLTSKETQQIIRIFRRKQ